MNNLRQTLIEKAPDYIQLTRLNRPIGTYLLLWPTLWALWIAAEGWPGVKLLVIFILGTYLMRSAGCIINDYADRNFDAHVKRTADRPLATGRISTKHALLFCALLCLCAFILVLFTNMTTILLSFGAVALAACYPFMKRYTHFPQVVLGAAFSWGIPMAFAARLDSLPSTLWLIYIATVLWTIVYDTFYAMVDRDDDIKLGLKSTAILFGDDDRLITASLQVCTIVVLIMAGNQFNLSYWYYLGLVGASLLFGYQQVLIHQRQREACFTAFLNNHWVGATIFAGIFLHYLLN